MTNELDNSVELQEFVRRAVENRSLLERVRSFMGAEAITDARIRNWMHRGTGIPDQVMLGAALLMLAEDDDLRATGNEWDAPASMVREHRDALARTQMWAESAWHVFRVDDEQGRKGHDVHVWRFWQNLTATSSELRWFTHASVVEEDVDVDAVCLIPQSPEAEPVPPTVQRIGTSSTVLFQTPVSRKPRGVGYGFVGKPGVLACADDGQTHEFLGGINAIPVRKSHFLLNIPARLIADPYPPLLTFASFVSPTRLIEDLVQEDKIARLLDPTSMEHRLVQPWGNIDRSQLSLASDEPIPQELHDAVSAVWLDFPAIDPSQGRRLAYASSSLPPPLAFQSFVYALYRRGR